MEIHNLMEDIVLKTVNELFDQEEGTKRLGYCTCYQCRMDTSFYVLNRTKAEYVISGRGVAYAESDYMDKLQRNADLYTLIREGWTRINQTKRPHFVHGSGKERPGYPLPPVFNFPPIIGRLFKSSNFEPLVDIQVSLFHEGKLMEMIDPNWQNPYEVVSNTAGTFIFWPYPETSERSGEEKVFEFEIRAKVEGFEDFQHFFEIKLVAEETLISEFSNERSYKLPDLCIFPK
jgi:competence protein ComFB